MDVAAGLGASAIVFLKANRVPCRFDQKSIEEVTLAVADGSMSKPALISWFYSVTGA